MARKPALDGFVTRRKSSELHSGSSDRKLPTPDITGFQRHATASTDRPSMLHGDEQGLALKPTPQHGLSRSDIDESLNQIDEPTDQGRGKKPRTRGGIKSRRRRIIKWVIIAIILLLIGCGIWIAVKVLSTSNSVFKGDVFGLIQHKKLQQDANGRSNILIVGTSEDDPGHQGAFLTDSIMILSVDQTNKNAYMFSIPRDLPVKYGRACNSGYAGKINEFFNCVNGDWKSEKAEDQRQAESRKFFGEVVGMDIQYSVHVNYSVMRDVVGALGGIRVTIESRDARGQMDSNFDWKCKDGNPRASLATMKRICPPNGHFIDYPNGPVDLDAEHALYLAQARGDIGPTYGFELSNFDREKNQQKILVAIREKAMSTGTLTNISKVSGLLDAIGKNLRTNFDTSEINTLTGLAKDIPSSSIKSLSFVEDNILNRDAVPTAGIYNFTELRSYLRKKIYAGPIAQEDPKVIVLNASGVVGAATTEKNRLDPLGVTVEAIGNAPTKGDYSAGVNIIYQITKTPKPKTAEKLSALYGAKPQVVTSVPGVTVGDKTDYVIILVKPPAAPTESTTSTGAAE